MDWMVFIARRLKELRAEKGITQEAFAEKAGFNYKYYQGLELSRSKCIRLDTVERLASAFNMEVWEFLKAPDKDFLNRCNEKPPSKIGRPPKKTKD